ncbi:MAG TPA: hypothetical protein VD994_13580 [Prosthecobacter sp.]|nr:hypothetical protein [Prosthecobacter sp.]
MDSRPPPLPLLRDFPDWQSPMVVKELRHGLRTRFFTLALIQFHILLTLVMGSALLGADQEMINAVFWWLALAVVLVAMPARGFAALTSEVSEGTLDMLTLTNMTAFRMVYGKWAALFSQTLLVASSLLPYMVARYHFGGVEVLNEAVALVIMVLASAVITAALVAFSTQKSVLLRLLLMAGVLLPVVPLVFLIVSLMFGANPLADVFTSLPLSEQLGFAGGIIFVAVYGTYLFLTLGASRFASPAENHSTTKRLVSLGVMTVLGGLGVGMATLHLDQYAAVWVLIPTVILVLIHGMDVMTEAMPRVPTVLLKFAHGGRLRRLAGRVLYPGWASGVLHYCLLCLAPVAIVAAITYRLGEPIMLKVILCILMANVVPVAVPILRDKLFMRWWIVQLVLFASGFVLVLLVQITDTREIAGLGVITPGTALLASTVGWEEEMVMGGAVAGCLWLLGAVCLAITEMRIYNELEMDARYCEDLKPQPAPHDSAG